MSAKTKIIIIEQEALEPWKDQVDLIDAALINHVHHRLMRRENQKIIIHEGVSCVWIHYPTVRVENWLISSDDRTLKRRFAKLVKLGLLVRTQVSVSKGDNGLHRGSRAFYGISEKLKAIYEELETVNNSKKQDTEGTPVAPQSYEGTSEAGHHEGTPVAPQSLGMRKGIGCPSRRGSRKSALLVDNSDNANLLAPTDLPSGSSVRLKEEVKPIVEEAAGRPAETESRDGPEEERPNKGPTRPLCPACKADVRAERNALEERCRECDQILADVVAYNRALAEELEEVAS